MRDYDKAPPGNYELHVLAGTRKIEKAVEVEPGAVVEVTVEVETGAVR